VGDILATFKDWLPLVNCHNAEWVRWEGVLMILKKCPCEVREVSKLVSQGTKRPAMDLGDRAGKKVGSILPELPNTTCTVMICWVSNGKDFVLAPKQFIQM
jgi:hypothetical protein